MTLINIAGHVIKINSKNASTITMSDLWESLKLCVTGFKNLENAEKIFLSIKSESANLTSEEATMITGQFASILQKDNDPATNLVIDKAYVVIDADHVAFRQFIDFSIQNKIPEKSIATKDVYDDPIIAMDKKHSIQLLKLEKEQKAEIIEVTARKDLEIEQLDKRGFSRQKYSSEKTLIDERYSLEIKQLEEKQAKEKKILTDAQLIKKSEMLWAKEKESLLKDINLSRIIQEKDIRSFFSLEGISTEGIDCADLNNRIVEEMTMAGYLKTNGEVSDEFVTIDKSIKLPGSVLFGKESELLKYLQLVIAKRLIEKALDKNAVIEETIKSSDWMLKLYLEAPLIKGIVPQELSSSQALVEQFLK